MMRDLDGVQVEIDLCRTEVHGDEVLIAHRHSVDETVTATTLATKCSSLLPPLLGLRQLLPGTTALVFLLSFN